MVPFVDLKPQHRRIKRELSATFDEALVSSMFILGPALKNFEKNFAKYLKVKYCLGVASGTEAIQLALLALGIKRGDEVIVPANTFIATALAVTHTGATPTFAEADPATFNLDPGKLEEKITKKTKAVVVVHMYGLCADIERILKVVKRHNLFLVEDCAQAHGAEIRGKKAGTFGDIACFSFYPTKNLGCLGDGGAVVTNSETLYKNLGLLRNYGEIKKYHHQIKGFNSRLDSLQAAILDLKLKYLDMWNQERRRLAKIYDRGLSDIKDIEIPKEPSGHKHVYYLYVIRAKRRAELATYLASKQIKTLIHYPVPIHLQPAYKDLGYKKGDFPTAEKLASEALSLPMFPGLRTSQQKEVISAIKSFYNKR